MWNAEKIGQENFFEKSPQFSKKGFLEKPYCTRKFCLDVQKIETHSVVE